MHSEEHQLLINQIHSGVWQEEASAWLFLRNRRPWLDWPDPSEPHSGNYKSFLQFCRSQKVTNATAYGRARLAEDPRFARLRDIEIEITTAEALYALPMDHELFEVVVELRRYGARERELRELLRSDNPMSEAKRIYSQREKENRQAQERLFQLLLDATNL